MTRKKFDNELQNKLEHFHSQVDVGDLWAAIESDVDAVNSNKNKKRKFIWFFSLIGLLSLVVIFFSWEKIKIDTTSNQQTSIEIQEAEQSFLPNTTKAINSKNNLNQKKTTEESLASNQKSETQNSTSQINNNTFTKKEITKKTRANFPLSNFIKSTNPSNEMSMVQNAITPKGNSSFDLSLEKNKNAANANEDFAMNSLTERSQLPVVFLLSKNKNTLNVNLDLENQDEGTLPVSEFPKFYQLPPKWIFSVGTQSGFSLLQRRLSAAHSEANEYINKRNATEKPLEAFQIGIHGNVLHRSGFEFSLGVQMTQLNEAFNYQESRMEFDTIANGLFGYYINPYGDTIPAYDQVINSKDILFSKKTINRYRMLDVPMLLGYHFQREKWSLGIQAGLIANIRLKTKGAILNEAGTIEDLETNQNSIFRTNVGWSYHIGASGRFFITKHLQVSINPFFRGFSKSFSKSDFSLKQNYQMLGGSIGLNYIF